VKTLVLAARSFSIATWIATGVRPRTSPPLTMATFDPHEMDGSALVYVCTHGLPGQPYLYGDGLETMCSAEQVRQARLDGAICYLAGCHGVGPMSDAFVAAGAACVVADRDSNWSGLFWPAGSNLLGRSFVRRLRRGEPAGEALAAALFDYERRHTAPRDVELVGSMVLVGDGSARLRVARSGARYFGSGGR